MTKTQRAILVLGTAVLCWQLCSGCRRDDGRTLNVVGSTSIQPFAELLGQAYGKKHPDHMVDVQGGGSTAGVQAVANGLAHIGMCSRSLKDEERDQFTPIIVARDGLAIIVNPSNPVSGLSREQLRDLFSGSIKNWKEVGGRDGPVRPITREEGSGTRESFVSLVMGKTRISRAALTQESNGAVKELVRGDPAAIGYMSLGLVGGEIKALLVDGEKPDAANVLTGGYKLVRPFLFVTKGAPTPEARQFITYVLSAEGQKALESEGLIRAQ
ncbi:MAG TPA: phosphate ABC transporter substrate-binding protein [Phycisphaerae bacterium]|nr:phosphate ABC transporter substrate-binding protein [Phycisphaerae bacterium]HRY70923.1 phosphate ABC transporter substrate-binding protein [Phycisphaerae bacterium]HSA27780.1 phosphate ABC transporter substrate-binding protein [Phycisphaerae bacterium]